MCISCQMNGREKISIITTFFCYCKLDMLIHVCVYKTTTSDEKKEMKIEKFSISYGTHQIFQMDRTIFNPRL